MPITINLAGVNTNEFAAVPEGRYRVTVYNCEAKKGKDSGKPYLNWELKIVAPEEYGGRRLWLMTSLSEAALFGLKGLLLALGESEEGLAGEFQLDPQAYFGNEIVVQVKHEEWKGEPRPRITRTYPPDTELGMDDDLNFETASIPPGGDNI